MCDRRYDLSKLRTDRIVDPAELPFAIQAMNETALERNQEFEVVAHLVEWRVISLVIRNPFPEL